MSNSMLGQLGGGVLLRPFRFEAELRQELGFEPYLRPLIHRAAGGMVLKAIGRIGRTEVVLTEDPRWVEVKLTLEKRINLVLRHGVAALL